jgi:hypothetical protein
MPKKANNKKVMTSLYIEKDLREKLDQIGKEEDRSFGWLVNYYLKKGLDSERRQK